MTENGDEPIPRNRSTEENALQRLISERRRHGHSYADIATAGGLSRSTVYYLATTQKLTRSPSASTLERLALGLGLPEEVVRRAAGEAVGLHIYSDHVPQLDPGVEVLVSSVAQLTPDQRQHVMALVRSLLAETNEGRQP